MRKLYIPMLMLVGCGAGSAKYRVDDASLASIPMQERQPIFDAQNEMNQAKAEVDKFKADSRNADHDVDVAENDYKTAKLSLDTAKLNKKSADMSGDINAKQKADRDVHVAELGVKAADARVDWAKKYRKWVSESQDAAEAHVAAADSRTELEKAKLAQAKGIRPNDKFDPMLFEQDYQDKSRKYSDAKLSADKLRPDVDGKEREYQTQQQAYDQARAAAGSR